MLLSNWQRAISVRTKFLNPELFYWNDLFKIHRFGSSAKWFGSRFKMTYSFVEFSFVILNQHFSHRIILLMNKIDGSFTDTHFMALSKFFFTNYCLCSMLFSHVHNTVFTFSSMLLRILQHRTYVYDFFAIRRIFVFGFFFEFLLFANSRFTAIVLEMYTVVLTALGGSPPTEWGGSWREAESHCKSNNIIIHYIFVNTH